MASEASSHAATTPEITAAPPSQPSSPPSGVSYSSRKRSRDKGSPGEKSYKIINAETVIESAATPHHPLQPRLPRPPPAEVVEENMIQCSLCPKSFPSLRSFSGHMKAHRARTWRGVYPPPMFRRQEFPPPETAPVDQNDNSRLDELAELAISDAEFEGNHEQTSAEAALVLGNMPPLQELAEPVMSLVDQTCNHEETAAVVLPPPPAAMEGEGSEVEEKERRGKLLDLNKEPPPDEE